MATETKIQGEAQAAEIGEVSAVDRAVGAAFIGSGIGTLVLGVVDLLTAMKAGAGLKSALNFLGPVGPLSGKTSVSVVAFVVSWLILNYVFKNKAVKLTTSFIITIVLLVIGLLMMFPPIIGLFAK